MPLSKFSDHIRAVADRGFLATCLCEGDTCTCSHDGQHFPIIHSKEKNMPITLDPEIRAHIEKMSAAKRQNLAEEILALPDDQRRVFLEQVNSTSEINAKFDARENQKRTAIANISACRSGSLAERNMINALEGNLRRAGISLDDIVAEPHKIDQIFVSVGNKPNLETRMGIKGQLYRLGVISQ
jgi:hypothetical protein